MGMKITTIVFFATTKDEDATTTQRARVALAQPT